MAPRSADTRAAAEPGAVIAGHRLVEVLRRGTDGAAFRAEAPDGAPVTIRVLRNPAGKQSAARFAERAELLSGLAEPALPRVLGFGEASEGLWVASAAVQGVSLRSLLAERMAPMRAVRLLGEVADALDAAHVAGLAHGDVRPENVVVQTRPVERAMLVDFALAPGSLGGTVDDERIPYSAPEILRGEEPGPAADVFALAVVLYECLAGTPPPEGGPQPLGEDVPLSLNATIAGGLATDPAARPSAAELMAEAARAFLDVPVSAPGPWITSEAASRAAPSEGPAAPPPTRRRRLLGALAVAVVVGGAGAGGYAISNESTPDEPTGGGTATAGVVTVAVPQGWEPSRTSGERARPSLTRPVAVLSSDVPGRIIAGLASDRAALLDPGRLAAEVTRRPPRPRRVLLGRLQALRFDRLGSRDASVLYVAPTTAGTATVACQGDRDSVARACAEAARGLAVRGARGYSPVAGIAWKNRLAADMRRLRDGRAAGLRRLRRARTRAGQGRRAAQVAAVHTTAARRLRARPAPPQAARVRRRVLARLQAAGRAYRSLARAAAGANEPGYRRATRRIRRADAALRRTLRTL